jgi:hypothetical protein
MKVKFASHCLERRYPECVALEVTRTNLYNIHIHVQSLGSKKCGRKFVVEIIKLPSIPHFMCVIFYMYTLLRGIPNKYSILPYVINPCSAQILFSICNFKHFLVLSYRDSYHHHQILEVFFVTA